MRMIKLLGAPAFVLAGLAVAQIPSGTQPDFSKMPTVSPDPGNPNDPMKPYYNATTYGEYAPYWQYHIWFNPDGTHILFYAHQYPDGSLHMGAAQRYWRLIGTKGHYYMCLRVTKDGKEQCDPFTDMRHYGDLWWQDYDRASTGDIPSYANVHEVFTFTPEKR